MHRPLAQLHVQSLYDRNKNFKNQPYIMVVCSDSELDNEKYNPII